ncbi:VOC family protein [Photobacterium sp. SDRW27]|uniref:VOC family protein n=1 Tax=Photobacterium obscurum TaxID=2829490 RepID=UPI0022442D70|nr:VOC family protein [Photobacterium obscurum]MCW8328849.1 VOC family protein [Photobacterium obscurum]
MIKRLMIVLAGIVAMPLWAAIPGLQGPDHIGFTVPNLSKAVTFFEEVIGCETAYRVGPFKSDSDWMEKHLNVDPRAEIPQLAMLSCGRGSNLEIFEYSGPIEQQKTGPKNSDVGGHHIGFYVDDINAAVSYLKSQNLKVLGEPTVMTSGPNAGISWVYFLSPWGMQLELVSYPDGVGYEKQTDVRLFDPRK